MDSLHIFCAGAAKTVVMCIAGEFQRERAVLVSAHFGAVGAMSARVASAEPVDIIILTAGLIDVLIEQRLIVAGSRADLGGVGTGIAVRSGAALPDVSSTHALRCSLLAATKIICPDPAVATAGKVLLDILGQLGIADRMMPKLEYAVSGHAAMARIAEGTGMLEIGVMQISEIIGGTGIVLAGPLPPEQQRMSIYSAGLAVRSALPDQATAFIRQLTGLDAHTALTAAGFEVG